MKLTINALFDQMHNVPQVPEVVRNLITQLNDPNSRYNDIAQNVEKEQMISMKVLRLVNSAHFGLSKKIGSINDALAMLGISQLKMLVISSGIVSSVPDIPNVDVKEFWGHSFRTANNAKWLAEQCKLENVDMMFTAGLICDLGIILIHLGDPKVGNEIEQHVKAGEKRSDFESSRLGFTSQQACAELCKRWHFAAELVDTVEKAGDPLSFEDVSLPACAVFVGRYVSELAASNKDEEEMLAGFPVEAWKKLGLKEQDVPSKLKEMLALESKLEGLID